MIISDINKYPVDQDNPNFHLIAKFKIRSAVQVPLCIGDRKLGILMVAHTEPREFTDAEIRLAELWGTLAAVTIANDQLYEQTSHALDARRIRRRSATRSLASSTS